MASSCRIMLVALILIGAAAGAAAPPPPAPAPAPVSWSMPAWVRPSERQLFEDTVPPADAVVSKDGTGDHRTVAEAVAAARRPSSAKGKYVIHVRSGIYLENVEIAKAKIMLIGDGIGKTVISGSRSNFTNFSMPRSATLFVNGDSFMARDLSIENTAGNKGKQAVALRANSRNSVFYRCSISGFQDTLYAENGRQFYRECDISGTIDFVFGNAKAVYQNCQLLVRRPQSENGRTPHNVITAQGRDGPDHPSGFSFQNCTVKARDDLAGVETYLGRPWRNHSHVVFMQCFFSDIVHPDGWVHWSKGKYIEETTRTIYYGEYMNTGPGADVRRRVNWAGFHVMNTSTAARYTVQEFINGSNWLPKVGVAYNPGL